MLLILCKSVRQRAKKWDKELEKELSSSPVVPLVANTEGNFPCDWPPRKALLELTFPVVWAQLMPNLGTSDLHTVELRPSYRR